METERPDPKQQANEVIALVDEMLAEALLKVKIRTGDPRIETGRGNHGNTLSTTYEARTGS